MEQLSISSIESAGTASLPGTATKHETVSAETFQSYLAEQSGQSEKKAPEKELDSKAKTTADKSNEELSDDSTEVDAAAFFYGFMSSVQEQTTNVSASVTEEEFTVSEPPHYIESTISTNPTGGATSDDNQIEAKTIILSEEKTSFKPLSNSLENKQSILHQELTVSLFEEEPLSTQDKEKGQLSSAVVQSVASETAETMVDEILPTSRLLTKDWAQTVKSALRVDKPAIEPNESIDPAEQLNELPQPKISENNSGKMNLFDKSGKEPSVLMGISVEKEPTTKNADDSNLKTELSGPAIVRGDAAEATGKAVESPKTIRQQVTQAVNEVITKTVETFQNGKHSTAKVSISPSSMGEITITLEMVDNVLSTKIMVESLKTQELLTGGVPKLSDNLNRQQIQLGEVTIQLTTNGETGSQFNDRQQEKNRQTSRLSNQVSFVEGPVTELAEEKSGIRSGRLSILV